MDITPELLKQKNFCTCCKNFHTITIPTKIKIKTKIKTKTNNNNNNNNNNAKKLIINMNTK